MSGLRPQAVLHVDACRKAGAAAAASTSFVMPGQRQVALSVLGLLCLGLVAYSRHCGWVTSEAYSSPSIVLISGHGPYRWGCA
jgi:dolichyl-diphosphooligosaccharide--protein glycosyltransferase